MLGKRIEDPYKVETEAGYIDGIGLLHVDTVMAKEKHTVQSEGRIINNPAGISEKEIHVKGYEIHMGQSTLANTMKTFIELDNGSKDGAISEDGMVFGTYLHGFFDHQDVRDALLNELRQTKGLEEKTSYDYEVLKEKAYDDLADLARQHMDIEAIKKIAGVK